MVVGGGDLLPKPFYGRPLYVGGACRLRGTDGTPGSFTFSPHGMGFIYSEEDVFNRVCYPSTRDGSPIPPNSDASCITGNILF